MMFNATAGAATAAAALEKPLPLRLCSRLPPPPSCSCQSRWLCKPRLLCNVFAASRMSEGLGVGLAPAGTCAAVGNVRSAAAPGSLEEAVVAVKSGKVIAVPTDTLYGLACDACSAEAVNRIYEIKGREQTKPLAICVADVQGISQYAMVDHLPSGLLENLLPGPVTIVLKRGEDSILDESLNPSLDSIGVRIPDYDFIRAISRGAGSALALTSANLSGHPSSVNVRDFENLWQHCEYVYDGGSIAASRAGSTIVDLSVAGIYKILRNGSAKDETKASLNRFGLVESSQ